jgi:hypothetical protein
VVNSRESEGAAFRAMARLGKAAAKNRPLLLCAASLT